MCQICTLNWDVEVGGNSQTGPRHSISCLFPFWYNRLASDRRQAALQHHIDDILLCLERWICVLKQYVYRESVLNNRISLYHFWRLNLSILSLPASHLCHQGLSWPCIFVRSTYQQVFWSRDYRSNFHQGQYLPRGGEHTAHFLKVVGNEKEGGSGKWQMIDIGLGLWWSMSVCLCIQPPSCIKSISFSAYSSPIIKRWPTD